jgi:glucose uptake protein GlcU
MNTETVTVFLSGAISLGYLVIAAFFLRFWTRTRDSLLGCFALAFCLLGLERCAISFIPFTDETKPFIYLLRLIAFMVIIIGIIVKNRDKK